MHPLAHLHTINHHKWLVLRHCFAVGLYRQGLLHDLSKYSPAEFWVGARYYQGNRSPNDAERQARGCSTAWLHHKGRNKHHLEYWIDYVPGGRGMGGMKMPVRYVVEMVCDRIAACEVYKGKDYTSAAPWEYYERTRRYITIHPETRALLEKVLLILRDQGEEAAYAYLRKRLRKGNY